MNACAPCASVPFSLASLQQFLRPGRLLSGVVTALLLFATSRMAADSAVVSRRGGSIRGSIEGSLQVVGDGSIVIESGGRIGGDLRVPGEKTPLASGPVVDRPVAASSRTTVDKRGTGVITGAVSPAEIFPLPHVLPPTKPAKAGAATITRESDLALVGFAGGVTLNSDKLTAILPSGSFDEVAVSAGTLVLGSAGASEPSRYEVRTLSVGKKGRLMVAGPVVLLVNQTGTVEGELGDASNPFLLDLRIAGGAFTLSTGGRLYGLVLAPSCAVTVENGAQLTGAVVCDNLVIGPGGKVTAVDPDWSAAPGAALRPGFLHRALRVQAQIPGLQAAFRHGYYPGATFDPLDQPFVMMAEGKRPREHPLAAVQEKLALFEACAALFVNPGFDRGGVLMMDYSADPVVAPGRTRNIVLTRVQFEAIVRTASGKSTLDAGVAEIRAKLPALDAFARDAFALAQP